MDRLLRFARDRAELVALAVVFVAVVGYAGLPGSGSRFPSGTYVQGAVGGGILALQAAALVLVYRSNRVINFAQIQIGTLAATIFTQLVQGRTFVGGLHRVCGGCIDPIVTEEQLLEFFPDLATVLDQNPGAVIAKASAPEWMLATNFWLAFVVSIVLAAVLTLVVYYVVIKRFTDAPRIVLTLVCVAAGLFLTKLGAEVTEYLFGSGDVVYGQLGSMPPSFTFQVGTVVFSTVDVAVLIAVAVVGALLTLFFLRSASGTVMRAASENPDRARTLGVNVAAVGARAWLIAGAVSGLASVLLVIQVGRVGETNYPQFIRVLAVAVLAGFASLWISVLAGIVLGMSFQLISFRTGSDALVSAVVFVLVAALLLVQRSRVGRAETEAQASFDAGREIRPTPAVLRDLGPVRAWRRGLAFAAVVIAVAVPFVLSPSQVTEVSGTTILGILALSLLVLTGWAGQISLGQFAFAAIGGWAAAVSGLPLPLALAVAMIAGAVAALVIGVPALRLRGQNLAIVTLAFALFVNVVVLSPRYLGRHIPPTISRPHLLGINFDDEGPFYFLTLFVLVLVLFALKGLRRSAVARTLIACRDNEQAAQVYGVYLLRARLTAFAISGSIAALAGGLLAYNFRSLDAGSFSVGRSVELFLVTVLGGLGSVAGPLVGVVFLQLTSLLARTPFASVTNVLADPGLGVIIIMLTFPGGLSGGLFALRDTYQRRIALRYKIDVPSLFGAKNINAELVPVAPKVRSGGGKVLVPRRFRPEHQWAVEGPALPTAVKERT